MKSSIDKIMLEAGSYIIGDPASFFDTDTWHEFQHYNSAFEETALAEQDDMKICIFSSAYGEGKFTDTYGRNYTTKSGYIAAIPCTDEDNIPPGSQFIEFDTEVECFDLEGYLNFGDICIDTAGDMEIEEIEESQTGYDEY
jgi:hypothetical protein